MAGAGGNDEMLGEIVVEKPAVEVDGQIQSLYEMRHL